jgi:hypothetical protein
MVCQHLERRGFLHACIFSEPFLDAIIGGGVCIFIYSCSHTLKQSLSKEIRRAEHGDMNIHPPPHNYRARNGPVFSSIVCISL